MRFFIELAYNGTRFSGYQIQPAAKTVQGDIEQVLSTILREKISVVGCGRTDAGVHAAHYILHFDYGQPFPEHFLDRINRMIGTDIHFKSIREVDPDAHARFDAVSRSYAYHLLKDKNPFRLETAWHYSFFKQLDLAKLQEAASVFLEYRDFEAFSKTHTDVKTFHCAISRSEWEMTADGAIYHVTANRFLRGMVRLIVGACINVASNKVTIQELRDSIESRKPLEKAYSVPGKGLFLGGIEYPY